jgi:hypothetical protein
LKNLPRPSKFEKFHFYRYTQTSSWLPQVVHLGFLDNHTRLLDTAKKFQYKLRLDSASRFKTPFLFPAATGRQAQIFVRLWRILPPQVNKSSKYALYSAGKI